MGGGTPDPATAPASASELLRRADEDEQLVERARNLADVSGTMAPLVRRLDLLSASADAMLHANAPGQLLHMPVMRLESLERHWRFNMQRFEDWRSDLQQATAPLVELAAAITRQRAEWEADRARIASKELPAVLAGRVDHLVSQLRRAEESIAGPLAEQLRLRQRGKEVGARIRQGQDAVARTIRDIDRRLLRSDSVPLWDARSLRAGGPDVGESLMQGLRAEARFASEYGGLANERALVLHTVQLLLLPLLMWISMRARRNPALAAGSAEGALFALTRPFSLWLLLAPMVVLVLQPDAPLLVHELAMLVAVVPVLRLTPRDDRRQLGAWIYVACGLFLLMRLGLLFGGDAFLYRIFLVALCLLGLAAMLWLVRRLGRSEVPWRWSRHLRIGAWSGAVLMLASVAANLVGNVSLAETLAGGVIDSGYLALMLYAAVSVCASVIGWLFARHAGEHAPAASFSRLLIRLVAFAGVAGWLVYSMERFRILRPVRAALTSLLTADFQAGDISISLGSVLVFAIAVLVVFWVARGVRMLVHDEVLHRLQVSRGVGNSVASLTYYAILVAGLLLALSAAGFKISQLAIVFGALGVGIGFGLQGVVANFVAGLVLMFERPIQPGDVVDVADTSGTVGEIGLRATTIRTFDGADVVVPNGALVAGNLTNWTLRDQSRRIEIKLGVAYVSKPEQVAQLLRDTAARTPGIVERPAPVAFFMEFGQSSLDFSLRAWTHDPENWRAIRSDLAMRLHRALGEAGIEIPFPQQDVHLRSVAQGALPAGPLPGQLKRT